MIGPSFWRRPFAHRGLHDRGAGRVENSLSAISAAVDFNYGLEIDVQLSADGRAMAFHDDALARLTGESGRVRDHSADELGKMALLGGGGDRIPTLEDALAEIDGRIPVLIEIKDQDGAMGPDVGPLEQAVAAALDHYAGPAAAMSFNPHSLFWLRDHAPDRPRGLVAGDYADPHSAHIAPERRRALAAMADFEAAQAHFFSYAANALPTARTKALRAQGVPAFCWTIRSEAAAHAALRHCDQITFEGYRPS